MEKAVAEGIAIAYMAISVLFMKWGMEQKRKPIFMVSLTGASAIMFVSIFCAFFYVETGSELMKSVGLFISEFIARGFGIVMIALTGILLLDSFGMVQENSILKRFV
jgi:hypothetical protein